MIKLYGEIGWEVTADAFLQSLDEHPPGTLDVRINSVGGDVFQGLAIYNALTRWDGETVAHIDGLAASMASVIAMAAGKVVMASASLLMIHNPQTFASGDQHDLAKRVELLETVRGVMVALYSKKTGLTEEQVIQMLDAETWMDAATAKRLGFADEVIEEDVDMAACLRAVDLGKFQNVPEFVLTLKQNTEPQGGNVKDNPKDEATPAAIKAAVDAATATERKRVAEIHSLCSKHRVTDLAAKFIDAGSEVPEVQAAILEHLAASQPIISGPSGREQGHTIEDSRDKLRGAASQWLLARVGEQEGGKRVVVAGDNPFKGMRMVDMARESLVIAGAPIRGLNPLQVVAAAITHGTSDFPNILQEAINKVLLNAFNTAGDTWSRFCAVGDLSDFRPHWRHIAGSFSDLAQLNESGEIQDGTLDDTRKESITGKTMARILNLSHQAIVNDDMGVFTGAARALGRSARRSVERDVYALLALGTDMGPTMSDSTTLFHANHANVGTGAPSTAAVAAAMNILMSQKLPSASSGVDEFIDLASPPIFVGPLGLAQDMKVVNESQFNHDSTKLNQPNKSRGMVGDIVGTPRRTGNPWYLFANPSELPVIEVGFVQGQREPQLAMEESFRQYGVAWRVVYDYGVAAVNWLGAYRSTGV